jgi:hypothetical protein
MYRMRSLLCYSRVEHPVDFPNCIDKSLHDVIQAHNVPTTPSKIRRKEEDEIEWLRKCLQ